MSATRRDVTPDRPGDSPRPLWIALRMGAIGLAVAMILGLAASVLVAAPGNAQADPSPADLRVDLSDAGLSGPATSGSYGEMLHAARADFLGEQASVARVVNGREAEPYEFASTVALVLAGEDDFNGQVCGGTAISSEWIVTAGHCLEPFAPLTDLEVLVGAWFLPLELGARIAICDYVVHPDFSRDLGNDIALVQLCSPHYHPTSALPAGSALDAPGNVGDVVGWGFSATTSDPVYTGEQRTARVEIRPGAICARHVGTTLDNPVIDAVHVCAGGSVDACNGDSGGPLLVGDFLVGITSFGDFPCEGDTPGVFTRVSAFAQWIAEITGISPGMTSPGVACGEAFATHVGTEADDTITTGDRGDVVVSLEGADSISTGDGIDFVCAGPGDDVVALGAGFVDAALGEEGNDVLFGQAGDDQLSGGPGDDHLRGGAGDDDLNGSDGVDDLAGGTGNDTVDGGPGDDAAVRGGTGDDFVDGGDGNDVLVAGNGGSDMVFGGAGDDMLVTGGPRPDVMSGGLGRDILKGHKGADQISGDSGDDDLRGGPQPDQLDGGDGTDSCTGGTTGDGATEADTADNCEGDLISIP